MKDHPIRVLHVVTHMNRGGLETMLMNYYRAIDRNKVQFDFLVHREYRADYDDEIEQLGGMIHRLPRLIPWSRSYLKALDHFFELHPEYRIVHVHQDCLSGVILRVAEKYGVPVRIAHSHSSSQDKDFKYPIKLFYKRLIPRYATALFACGQKAGEWMFGNAFFHILKNAIEVQSFEYTHQTAVAVRRSLHIPENCIVVGHTGRFSPPKNHAFLVDIFALLAAQNADYRLLLVGDGELRTKIENRVRMAGLSDKVIFTGVQTEIGPLLSAMDVFVFPSLYEGLGISVVEAQATGLPCVISDCLPVECEVTALVKRLSLGESAENWANVIRTSIDKERHNFHDEIVDAGYGIIENAKKLEEFYLARWKGNGVC